MLGPIHAVVFVVVPEVSVEPLQRRRVYDSVYLNPNLSIISTLTTLSPSGRVRAIRSFPVFFEPVS